jgi:peptidoglycan/LPS O-acetylase OafA/YrhL
MKSKRIPNLDLIRAAAIVMVLIYHTVQWLPAKHQVISFLSQPGQYGVELFFALSGFLVGGLYFNEFSAKGSVDTGRFILRRVTRTVPPYLLALAPAFLGSYLFENEYFRWEYLLFFQNYIERMPYFLISWSLCVEEHFYLFLPFVLALLLLAGSLSKKMVVLLVATILLLPSFLRVVSYKDGAQFGFYQTASHFHLDTLSLGVLMAWFSAYGSDKLSRLHNYRYIIIPVSLVLLLLTNLLDKKLVFTLGLLIIGIAFALSVLSLSYGKQYKISSHKAITALANSSYAVYLTHAMVIQALTKANSLFKIPTFPFWIMMIICCLITGYAFHVLFEVPLMRLRNVVIPSRS